MYLPPEKQVTIDFLKQILAGHKQLLLKIEVKPIKVKAYDELSVKRLWPGLQDDPVFS